MTSRAVLWAVGLAGSALVHLAAGSLYLVTRAFDDVPDQPGPESRLHMDTVTAPTQTAQEHEPQSDAAREAKADGTDLNAGTVPQSEAFPVTPRAAPLVAQAAPAQTLSQASPQTAALSAAPAAAQIAATIRPAGTTVRNSPALSEQIAKATLIESVGVAPAELIQASLAPGRITSDTFSAATPDGDPVSPSQPIAASAATTTPVVQPANTLQPDADAAAHQAATGTPAREALADITSAIEPPLPVTRTKAELAWRFGDRLVTDPQALATIQAFMAPSALEDAATLRDGLSALLTDLDCARVSGTFVPETGTLELRGHIPDPSLAGPLLEALRSQVGGDIPVAANLQHLPAPQCRALSGIATLGLPQSTDQFTDSRLIGDTAQAQDYLFSEGKVLRFDLQAPEYPAHVYVDYFDAAGQVIHLMPNLTDGNGPFAATSTLQVVPTQPGSDAPILIGPPFGQEIAVAFAASAPLYDTRRPTIEPAAEYLGWLRDRVAAAEAADPDFKGEWVYFFVTTRPAIR
ncbi:DUF4384 domain-containing protein [Roseovarius sp. 217]|uniref:DUF4384 domain-containing protein n=1 Tax=Roseovarius sp. (strain 217) TaxID=314264 RepID=UPI000068491E|nr:DUF4384 domain-containing protein [Roseovarius sp. 217]EAQ25794.1 probable serine/threonine protein kinase [Roseovarius sp. 217]